MDDTLRSIAEKWREAEKTMAEGGTIEVDRRWLHGYATGTVMSECANELEALLSEYEKVDLVKKLRSKKVTEMSYPREWSDKMTGEQRETLEALVDHIFEQAAKECAAELETWLAVNLERIKAEARLEEAKWWSSPDREHGPRTLYLNEKERLAALEAQAKGKP